MLKSLIMNTLLRVDLVLTKSSCLILAVTIAVGMWHPAQDPDVPQLATNLLVGRQGLSATKRPADAHGLLVRPENGTALHSLHALVSEAPLTVCQVLLSSGVS